MIGTFDLTWLAGLLEGEGAFTWLRHFNKTLDRQVFQPRISLEMCDRDVVEHAARLMCPTSVRRIAPRSVNHKEKFVFVIGGDHAAAWMMTLWPLMGDRRRARMAAALSEWRSQPRLKRRPRTVRPANAEIEHGTRSGYHLHYLRRELPPCEPCIGAASIERAALAAERESLRRHVAGWVSLPWVHPDPEGSDG